VEYKILLNLWLEELKTNKWHLNPLNAKLNPICHLLTVLAHPILHVSRIRVKSHRNNEKDATV
jgi:hypothetical protein